MSLNSIGSIFSSGSTHTNTQTVNTNNQKPSTGSIFTSAPSSTETAGAIA